jgi:hypothetical protein
MAGEFDWGASASAAGVGAGVGQALIPIPGVGAAIGAGVGFLAPIIGDLIGRALASGDREEADRLMKAAVDRFGPDILKAPEIAELTPHLGPSAVASVYADPQAVAAQRQAVDDLRRASRPDNLEFRAATNDAEAFANQQAGAQQGAIQQQMAARGMSGSGVDFALRQQAGQDAANRASGMGFNAAVDGRPPASHSMRDYGSLASQMRGQSFGEGVTRGQAADSVARFNEAGRIAGQQQAFDNNFRLQQARANMDINAANVKTGQAGQTQQQWAGYGQGAGQAAGGFGQYAVEEQRRAEDRAERERARQAGMGG